MEVLIWKTKFKKFINIEARQKNKIKNEYISEDNNVLTKERQLDNIEGCRCCCLDSDNKLT